MSLPSSRPKEQDVSRQKKQDIAREEIAPFPKPKILWPSIEYGRGIQSSSSEQFPSEDRIKTRYENTTLDQEEKNALVVYALDEFEYAIMEAVERLWIIDSNFDAFGVASILDAVSSSHVKQIWILTGAKAQKEYRNDWLSLLKKARNDRKAKDHTPGDIQWKIGLSNEKYPYLHDRFAIVDQELWHFGATVGGGHPSLNAASRGWDADKTGAIAFFKNVWFRNDWY
jgi:hypothetical protein